MMTNKMMKNANVNPGTTKVRPASVLPKVTNPQPTPIDRLKDWWKNHFGEFWVLTKEMPSSQRGEG